MLVESKKKTYDKYLCWIDVAKSMIGIPAIKHDDKEDSMPEAFDQSVSVIVPAFNCGDMLVRALESVFAQVVEPYEVIVIDDGSTDNTAEVAGRYVDRIRLIQQANDGASVARNTGIKAARYTWIAFLDADDEWLPGKMEKQFAILKAHPDIRWCAGNFIHHQSGREQLVQEPEDIDALRAGKDYLACFLTAIGKQQIRIQTSTIIVHREIFTDIGLFEPQLLRAQDTDLWWRIGYRYPRIGFLADPLARLHFDVPDEILEQRRLWTKSGRNRRLLVRRHLELSQQAGKPDIFLPVGRRMIRQAWFTNLFNGLRDDARATVDEFGQFFTPLEKRLTYAVTIWPNLTAHLLRGLSWMTRACRLRKTVTRQYSLREVQQAVRQKKQSTDSHSGTT